MKVFFKYSCLGFIFFNSIVSSHALDADAGGIGPVPAGTNFFAYYYQHAERDKMYIGNKEAEGDQKLVSDVMLFRFGHYYEFLNVPMTTQLIIPYSKIEAKEDISSLGSDQGLGDIFLSQGVFIYRNDAIKGSAMFTQYLAIPTGDYDRNKSINIGENRYKYIAQLSYTRRILPKIAGEIIGDTTFYGSNNDLASGGKLKQDNGFQIQTNARYFLKDNWDLRAALSYADLGNVEKNGVKTDGTKQSKFWVGTSYSPTKTTNFIVYTGRDIAVENGFKENLRVNFRFVKLF
ncbi:TPA: transporter [Acinetobacter baumannii]|nr:transporter [Acinetobacter baumannii]MDC5215476.1 transporter [Acinetobacter baumannii]NUG32721.1 transporter [Acinetobacter baumannii]HEN9518925.1 transporter [Acinetobacter baumannii]